MFEFALIIYENTEIRRKNLQLDWNYRNLNINEQQFIQTEKEKVEEWARKQEDQNLRQPGVLSQEHRSPFAEHGQLHLRADSHGQTVRTSPLFQQISSAQ